MEIRAIKSLEDHAWTLGEIERLLASDSADRDDDLLDVLSTLAHAYESKNFEFEAPEAVDVLKFALNEERFSKSDLDTLMGGEDIVDAILSGRSNLDLQMIWALNERFAIPIELLTKKPKNF